MTNKRAEKHSLISVKDTYITQAHALEFKKHRDLRAQELWCSLVEKALRTLPVEAVVLADLGCGTGRFTLPLARLDIGKPLLIYAVDRSPSMTAHLRAKLQTDAVRNVTVINEDIRQWRPPSQLNAVFLSEVLALIPDHELFLESLQNWFAGDGIVLIRTPSHAQIDRIEWLKYFQRAADLDKQRTPDTSDIVALFTRTGFRLCALNEVDESIQIPRDDYIAMLEAKAYSILHMLDEVEFNAGIEQLRRSIHSAEMIRHNLFLTFLALTIKKETLMGTPFKKSLSIIPREDAHGGSGSRQLILSKADSISAKLEAMTKGFLKPSGFFDWHHHEQVDEFFVVLKGNGRVIYKNADDTETIYDYNPGDVFYTPTGISHRIECSAAGASEYFFVRVAS